MSVLSGSQRFRERVPLMPMSGTLLGSNREGAPGGGVWLQIYNSDFFPRLRAGRRSRNRR